MDKQYNLDLTIYYFEGCPYCDDLKNKLDKNEIPYLYKDVNSSENTNEFKMIMDLTGRDVVPIVLIEGKLYLPNKDFNTIDEIVEIIKLKKQ